MKLRRVICDVLLGFSVAAACVATGRPRALAAGHKPPTMADVLKASKPSDWRRLDPQNTLYMQLATGRVVIELAPRFAPRTVANIKKLVREKYFDGLAILRVQDNYVVQWGDPAAENDKLGKPRQLGKAARTIKAEFTVPYGKDFPFTRLPDIDGYAPQVGLSGDFWAARDPNTRRAWLTHCYGAVGVGRDNDPDSGSGAELYAVIGNAPRHLDRNITVVGRVVQGMPLLSSLPRGTGALGFYEKPSEYVPIKSVRLAADVAPAQRTDLEALRTDTPTFKALVESRRNRRESWFYKPAGYVSLCNVPIPVRQVGNGKH